MLSPQAHLDALKAECLAGESEHAHAQHAADLEAAHLAASGQTAEESRPAEPGTTNLEAHLVADASAGD